MSEKLPVVSGKKMVRFLQKRGWEFQRQTGSHIILAKPGVLRSLVVPNHKEIKRKTLLSIIHAAGILRDEFILAMKK